MTAVDASGFVEALADERILEPDQYAEFLNSMFPICQDVVILAKELVYRGWLTPFQVEHIAAGQIESLFLGSYVLLEQVGEGGMGRVYRARNWKLNRIVAIKVLGGNQARQPAAIARFQREIRALGRIRHPNIVMAIDADFHPGTMFFAMEYFEGTDLGRYVAREGPLSIAEACRFMLQAADALQHAHQCGLIHRDIKPSNLLLTEPDHVVKMLDLGLTRCEAPLDDSAFNDLTRAGTLIGTPDYMAPEQVQDSRDADCRSDLYSLGCTFYYLLTGAAPFAHMEAVVDKLYSQCENEPQPIETLRLGIPPEVTEIVRKLMAKRRRDRFQTAAELVSRLQILIDDSAASVHDTLLDAKSITLTDTPQLPRHAPEQPPTLLLSHAELGLVMRAPAPDEPPRRWWRKLLPGPTPLLMAVLVITLALMMIWQTKGSGGRDQKPPALEQTAEPEE